MKAHQRPELLPVFYFYLKNAYLANDKDNLNFYMKILLKALKTIKKEEIEKNLHKKHIEDIIKITNAIKDGYHYYDFTNIVLDAPEKNMFEADKQLWVDEEKILEEKIAYEYFEELNDLLGIHMQMIDTQYKTENGPIDILAQDNRTIHIIELKKDIADHKIIGQIIKYAEHFQKRFIYNLWDDINIITVAGGYNDFTYNELKKLNVTTLTYELHDEKIKLILV